jgi:uncharacterized protein YndB with AHSA1/START domain
MTETAVANQIEKSIQLQFPRHRVWRALTTAREFGAWFGVTLEGEFAAGQPIHGKHDNAKYAHIAFEVIVDTIRPETLFSYHWRPFAIEADVDYSAEPRTLVTFTLEDRDGGTLLTVVESGFDGIPAARRALAFEMDSKGWASQMVRIEKYLQQA